MDIPINKNGILEDLRRLLNLQEINNLKPILPKVRITATTTEVFLSFKGTNFYAIGTYLKFNHTIPSKNLINYPSLYDLVATTIIQMPFNIGELTSRRLQLNADYLNENLGGVLKSLAGTL